jgi:dGTPase
MLTVEDLNPSLLYRSASAQARESVRDGDVRVVRSQTVIRMIDAMSTDLVTQIAADLERSSIGSVEGIRRAGRSVATFSPEMTKQVAELKEIMRQRLYRHYRVNRMTEKAGRVLARLFETYLAEPGQMPEHILKRAEQDQEPIARVVADYVAGMTDRFALDEYRKLFDPDERV